MNATMNAADCFTSIPVRLRYNVALLYLDQSKYDLDAAVEAYLADENWERDHPIASSSKVKSKQNQYSRKMSLTTGLPHSQ